jgi:hypothetical protein
MPARKDRCARRRDGRLTGLDVYYTLSVNFQVDSGARGDPTTDSKPPAPP